MTIQQVLFGLLALFTFYNNGVQFYIHQEAYPLFALVGKTEFAAYLDAYEKRLTLVLLLPYGLTLLVNLALLLVGSSLAAVWLIAAFVLNLAVAVVTMTLATPIYNRIKQAGTAEAGEMSQLMRVNLLRLLISTLSSLVILFLLLTVVVV